MKVDGEKMTFNCVEQYIMYTKAIFFQEHDLAKTILQESNPIKVKWIAKSLKRYKQTKWHEISHAVLLKALRRKFQDDTLKEF